MCGLKGDLMNPTVEEVNKLLAQLTLENEELKKQIAQAPTYSPRILTDEERARFKKHNSRYHKIEPNDETNQMLALVAKTVAAIDEQNLLTKKLQKQKG